LDIFSIRQNAKKSRLFSENPQKDFSPKNFPQKAGFLAARDKRLTFFNHPGIGIPSAPCASVPIGLG
jgi:hypothetical protein